MELNEYLRIFRRRWILILVSTLCGVIAAGIVTSASTPRYDAEAALFVRADSQASSSFENSQFVLQRVKSYPDLVYSPQVLNPVLEELDSSMTLSELSEQVSASNPAETVYVNVTATAETPEEAATIANAVAQNLRDVIRQLEGGDTARNAAVEAFVTVPAVAPEEASAPNTVLNLAIGLLAGLALGLIAAIALGAARRRVRGSADMPRSFDTRMIGSVISTGPRAAAKSPQEALQYRRLLTALLLERGGQLPKLLLLTTVGQQNDAQRAFGPQFAGFIGDSGARACMIDSTSQQIGREETGPGAERGFSDVLVGEATLNDVVLLAEDGTTYRIPSGTATARVSRYQAARQGASILKELNDQFDVTLVTTSYDSHPLSTSTVAPVAEAALVLVSYGTPVPQLENTLRDLQAMGVEPVGAVLVGGPRRLGGPGPERIRSWVRTSGRG